MVWSADKAADAGSVKILDEPWLRCCHELRAVHVLVALQRWVTRYDILRGGFEHDTLACKIGFRLSQRKCDLPSCRAVGKRPAAPLTDCSPRQHVSDKAAAPAARLRLSDSSCRQRCCCQTLNAPFPLACIDSRARSSVLLFPLVVSAPNATPATPATPPRLHRRMGVRVACRAGGRARNARRGA